MIFVSIGVFLTCGVALALTGWIIGRRHADASVTGLFDRLMSDPPVRLAIIVLWWWLGWHFLAGQTL